MSTARLARRLTTRDLTEAFGVTLMTIANWKAGTPTRTPLPFVKEGRAVRFNAAKVRRWAEANGIAFADEKALEGTASRKPGPKPREQAEVAVA